MAHYESRGQWILWMQKERSSARTPIFLYADVGIRKINRSVMGHTGLQNSKPQHFS